MQSQAMPEFIISQMRVQLMPEITFFYVASQPMPFTDLDKDFDALLDSLYAAKAQANLGEAGPDITRYYKVSAEEHPNEPNMFLLEIGIPVKPGTQPAGAAQVKTLPPYPCVGLLLWGSLLHIGLAYETLHKALQEAGLEPTGENREWNYYFQSSESPHNLMGLYMGVKNV